MTDSRVPLRYMIRLLKSSSAIFIISKGTLVVSGVMNSSENLITSILYQPSPKFKVPTARNRSFVGPRDFT
jgi:hypothetical protein